MHKLLTYSTFLFQRTVTINEEYLTLDKVDAPFKSRSFTLSGNMFDAISDLFITEGYRMRELQDEGSEFAFEISGDLCDITRSYDLYGTHYPMSDELIEKIAHRALSHLSLSVRVRTPGGVGWFGFASTSLDNLDSVLIPSLLLAAKDSDPSCEWLHYIKNHESFVVPDNWVRYSTKYYNGELCHMGTTLLRSLDNSNYLLVNMFKDDEFAQNSYEHVNLPLSSRRHTSAFRRNVLFNRYQDNSGIITKDEVKELGYVLTDDSDTFYAGNTFYAPNELNNFAPSNDSLVIFNYDIDSDGNDFKIVSTHSMFTTHPNYQNVSISDAYISKHMPDAITFNGRMYPSESDIPRQTMYGYHDTSRVWKAGSNPKFTVGFEIEKEDASCKYDTCANRIYYKTGWAKERDGSLDDDIGYELVSPTYDLMSDDIFHDINKSTDLLDCVNAFVSTRCGGHIHIGENGVTGRTFFDKISPWIPLFYSIYVGRISRNYCKVKKNIDIIEEFISDSDEKYQSVRIFTDRIELRIPSAVDDLDTLRWRVKLLRHICNNLSATPMSIMQSLLDNKSSLYSIMNEEYTSQKILVKARLYAYFSNNMLDISNSIIMDSIKSDELFNRSQIQYLKSIGAK